MLFKKLLSSIGIGAATVDTKLAKAQYVQGETVEGVVDIRGGSIEQHIDEIYLALVTTYLREIDDKKHEEKAVLARYKVSGSLTIGPNETKTIPFQFALPYDVPVTLGSSRVWLQTGLDIKTGARPARPRPSHHRTAPARRRVSRGSPPIRIPPPPRPMRTSAALWAAAVAVCPRV